MYDTLAFELVANLEVTSVRVNIILSKEKTWKKKLADFLSGPVMCKFSFE